MPNTFRDYIPAGEDTDALGNGFTDFVPAKQPQVKETVEETPEEKKRREFLERMAKGREAKKAQEEQK